MSRTVAVVLAAFLAFAIVACAGGAGGAGATEAQPSVTDEFTVPSADKSFGPGARSVSGTLRFDDVEGGCAYLEAADGTRYEVVYPEGWTIDRALGELRTDDGPVVAAGEAVTVRGSVATDRSSTCQIGPIFVATSVEVAPD
jgi:hypothetical protein